MGQEWRVIMDVTVLCYSRCSTCKKALKWLEENGIGYSERPIKEENPTKEELAVWYKKSGLPLKRFFNTSGTVYKELKLKDKLPGMSEEEQLELLSTDNVVLTGFKEDEWKVLLEK